MNSQKLIPKPYLSSRLHPELVALYSHLSIKDFAINLISLFSAVYIYLHFGRSIIAPLIFYASINFLYAIFLPLGVRVMSKIGLKRSMSLGLIFRFLYFLCLFLLEKDSLLVIPAVLCLTIHDLLYWVPFHSDIARFTNKKNRGKEMALYQAVQIALAVVAPIAAAFIITRFGFPVLFLFAAVLVLISGLPLIITPRVYETFTFSYKGTFKELFSKENRRNFIAFFASGIEGKIGGVVWPIFIFILLAGQITKIGFLSAAIVFVTLVSSLIMGRFIDEHDTKKIIRLSTLFYALAWIVKIFISSGAQVFITDSYHRVASLGARFPFDTLTYERAADQGQYVDEFTVLKEMALNFGYVFITIILINMSFFVDIKYAFVFAAAASFFFSVL
ncbi:hypothetical protein COY23_01560 [bacterium (Candidatus Torokbacteria) CG_4_10_14_0_2_um_filter_35_8]|nr:MAG: hypothetical protein COY23_01560 [bacterium (Candidatus Torokbacteria) CG_4_10_14_0_2_um_filter_35_8]